MTGCLRGFKLSAVPPLAVTDVSYLDLFLSGCKMLVFPCLFFLCLLEEIQKRLDTCTCIRLTVTVIAANANPLQTCCVGQSTLNIVAISAVSFEQLLVSNFKQFIQTIILQVISECVKILQKILSICV